MRGYQLSPGYLYQSYRAFSVGCVTWSCLVGFAGYEQDSFYDNKHEFCSEIGLFIGLLLTCLVFWIYTFLHYYSVFYTDGNYKAAEIVNIVLSVFLGSAPCVLFVYMCLSFRQVAEHVQAQNENENHDNNPFTTGLQTAPPSTRVSLPSDTADHAPNFLSPSGDEISEVTPLINDS